MVVLEYEESLKKLAEFLKKNKSSMTKEKKEQIAKALLKLKEKK